LSTEENSMTDKGTQTENPLKQEPQPPFPEQQQAPPGLEKEMRPKPDYGEQSYQGYGRLTGKKAIITGGDSGIGRAVALAFAREGADVLIAYLNEDPDAEETVRVVEEAGRKGVAVAGDIGDRQHCFDIVQRAVSELGGVDILVNNAAFQMQHQSITEIPPEEIERVFRTNILAMFWMCQAAIPHMQAGSTIINTTSIQASDPSPGLIHYASTKGAIETFTRALASELIEKGIRVNAVAPGPVWTPLIVMSFPAEANAKFGQQSPEKRPAQPVELAPAYVFLASQESSYIVGEVIAVTGGEPFR
jgi:NAD(P)-dependent dehydrogenase (short-subunit alcohol dehydrogenase family)